MSRLLATAAAFAALFLLAAPPASAGDDDRWIHVAVDGDRDERVRVNLPLSLVEVVLPLIEEEEFRHGRIHLEGEDLDHEDIVAILRAIEAAEDGEYVTVEDGHDTVRVAKEGEYILVNVDEGGRRGDHVDIRMPVAVLTALVSGDDDTLDLMAAVRALGEHESGDLVAVNDSDGTTVRVWIDDQNSSE